MKSYVSAIWVAGGWLDMCGANIRLAAIDIFPLEMPNPEKRDLEKHQRKQL